METYHDIEESDDLFALEKGVSAVRIRRLLSYTTSKEKVKHKSKELQDTFEQKKERVKNIGKIVIRY